MTTNDQPLAPVLSYGVGSSNRGNGFLALGGTVLFPGLGHILIGYFRRRMIWLILALALRVASLELFASDRHLVFAAMLSITTTLVFVGAVIDAFWIARHPRLRIFDRVLLRFVIGFVLIFVGLGRGFLESALTLPIINRHLHPFIIASKSMAPTLEPGDRIAVATQVSPRRWDVVAYRAPHPSGTLPSIFAGRVVGLPNETVEITPAGVLINGKAIKPPAGIGPYVQPRLGSRNGCNGNPIFLAADEYYILDDNTAVAPDSRYWDIPAPGHQRGALPATNIIGVSQTLYWPLKRFKDLSP